jgi:transcription elongation factor Elf1
MKTLLDSFGKRLFPCPVCVEGLPVRESKKGKPYVICNACGVQLFVRTEPGIRKFEVLVADAEAQNIWERLKKLESRYRKKCPKCGKAFWVEEKLIETSWFDGAVIGYRCPEPDCDGVVKSEEEE